MAKKPKEDPEDKKARQLERRKSLLERRQAAEGTAGGLTTDLRAVYGVRGMSMFGMPGLDPIQTPRKNPAQQMADHIVNKNRK